jgi:hypothetical protein
MRNMSRSLFNDGSSDHLWACFYWWRWLPDRQGGTRSNELQRLSWKEANFEEKGLY